MRTRHLTISGWAVGVLMAFGASAAQQAVTASDGRIELPAEGEATAKAFATLKNPTMYDHYLISARSDAAGKIEFRRAGDGGDSTAAAEITLPAYGSVTMAPDGWYMLLSELEGPLTEGDTITLSLKTDAGTLEVEAVVGGE